jgi:hypothetical protein
MRRNGQGPGDRRRRGHASDARFQDAGAGDVIRMFETDLNEKGENAIH